MLGLLLVLLALSSSRRWRINGAENRSVGLSESKCEKTQEHDYNSKLCYGLRLWLGYLALVELHACVHMRRLSSVL